MTWMYQDHPTILDETADRWEYRFSDLVVRSGQFRYSALARPVASMPQTTRTTAVLDSLEVGEPMRSVVDDMFAKLLTGSAGVEIIPVDEACEGVNNMVVSYYSRLYRIERCRKREIISPELFMKKAGRNLAKLKEMSSEQWLSLPDGEPMPELKQ